MALSKTGDMPGMFAGTHVRQGAHAAPDDLRAEIVALYEKIESVWGPDSHAPEGSEGLVHDRLLHDDFSYTDTFGRLHDKQYYLGLIDNYVPNDEVRFKTIDVRVYDGVVIANGTYEWLCREPNREEFRHDVRFTGMWVKEEGEWRNVAHQSTVQMGGVSY